jgi:hypothetical protein
MALRYAAYLDASTTDQREIRMYDYNATMSHRIIKTVFEAAIAVTLAALASVAHAAHIPVPPLPDSLQVPAGNKPFLLGKAYGTQNYVCLPSGADAAGNPVFAWKLFTPEATLFSGEDGESKQIATHFFSPNPDETNADPLTSHHPIRAAWQSSKDTSVVWARTMVATDAVAVNPAAIPWLKLTVVGSQEGKAAGVLTKTSIIHRVNTTGGLAPAPDTCDSLQEVGRQAYVPYTADYIFYTD